MGQNVTPSMPAEGHAGMNDTHVWVVSGPMGWAVRMTHGEELGLRNIQNKQQGRKPRLPKRRKIIPLSSLPPLLLKHLENRLTLLKHLLAALDPDCVSLR